jgi:hypothetical protein
MVYLPFKIGLFCTSLIHLNNMGTIIKIVLIFSAIWILWYLTGGPLRDDKSRPYIGPNASGQLETFGTSTRY